MDNIQQTIDELEKQISAMFSSESSGHDIYHLKRVLNLALHIQKKEGGDRFVVAVSAFLHDIHRILQKETGRYCSPKDSLPKVDEIIRNVGIKGEQAAKILHCIELHEEYNFSKDGKTAKDIETLIVQDADNLDAMGAVGIARAFSYGGAHGVPIWNPNIPFSREVYDESENDPSEIHHFYSKLFKLKDNMNTKIAKKMAIGRHKALKDFLKEFFKEWCGKI